MGIGRANVRVHLNGEKDEVKEVKGERGATRAEERIWRETARKQGRRKEKEAKGGCSPKDRGKVRPGERDKATEDGNGEREQPA
jgi:hypothetical protein